MHFKQYRLIVKVVDLLLETVRSIFHDYTMNTAKAK